MLNKQWLLWLPHDVISHFKVSKFAKYRLTLMSCIFATKIYFLIMFLYLKAK